MEFIIRFLLGGTAVCLFAAIGDVARPKSFAGVFGAAPSVALSTLALTIHTNGAAFAATEARSMIVGAFALSVYAWLCRIWFWRGAQKVTIITLVSLPVWLAIGLAGAVLLWRAHS